MDASAALSQILTMINNVQCDKLRALEKWLKEEIIPTHPLPDGVSITCIQTAIDMLDAHTLQLVKSINPNPEASESCTVETHPPSTQTPSVAETAQESSTSE